MLLATFRKEKRIACERVGSASRSKEKREDAAAAGEAFEAKIQSKVAGMADGGISRKLEMSEEVV